ncbi:MAG: Gfo/Idh/MocA family oxidoreductase [Planctomycetota bacterium]
MATTRGREKTDRREFLKESAGSLGALALGATVLPAATQEHAPPSVMDVVRLGVVGVGSRGGTLVQWLLRLQETHRVQIAAVCDLWERRREQAAEKIERSTGMRPAVCRTPAELFARNDVDGVLIATPDFQHCYLAAQAALAGKDVYVEKPFGCDFDQVRAAREILAKSDRIVQLGVQSRGAGKYYEAARFIQSGKLGQVTYVDVCEPICQQRWRIPQAELALNESDIDWSEFLAYLPCDTPFSSRHYREFRLFWPYSSGPFCQWMSHRIDLVNLILGEIPTSAVALGGVYLWKDGRNNPDTVQCLLEYPQGVLVNYHMRMGNSQHGRGMTIYGTCGTLEVDAGLAYGDGGGGMVIASDPIEGTPTYEVDKTKLLRMKREGGVRLPVAEDIDYLGHFIDCMRTRQTPRGDLDAAYGQSVATILAARAHREGCKMVHDPFSRTMVAASSTRVVARELPGLELR